VRRYKSLSVLQLPWISQARAVILARAFVQNDPLPTVQQLSKDEPFATPKEFLQPKITTNSTLRDLEAAAERLQADSCAAAPNGSSISSSDNGSIGMDVHTDLSGRTTNGAGDVTRALLSASSSPLQQALQMYSAYDYVLLPCDSSGASHLCCACE
jgi:hypothetical protein